MTLISWNIIHTEAKFKDEKQKEEDYWWERWFNFDKEAKTRNVSYLNILMTIKKISFENILYKMIHQYFTETPSFVKYRFQFR